MVDVMADANFDPIGAWQKFISDWEKQVNEASTRVTGTEEFSAAMNQMTKFSMASQQQFDRHMEQFLNTVHLPSKNDVEAINERLAAIEEAVERLTALISRDERFSADAAAKAPAARTRQPPPDPA